MAIRKCSSGRRPRSVPSPAPSFVPPIGHRQPFHAFGERRHEAEPAGGGT